MFILPDEFASVFMSMSTVSVLLAAMRTGKEMSVMSLSHDGALLFSVTGTVDSFIPLYHATVWLPWFNSLYWVE